MKEVHENVLSFNNFFLFFVTLSPARSPNSLSLTLSLLLLTFLQIHFVVCFHIVPTVHWFAAFHLCRRNFSTSCYTKNDGISYAIIASSLIHSAHRDRFTNTHTGNFPEFKIIFQIAFRIIPAICRQPRHTTHFDWNENAFCFSFPIKSNVASSVYKYIYVFAVQVFSNFKME